MTTTTHRIQFPHVNDHTVIAFTAEVAAPSYALALRQVLEYMAAEGHALESVRITGVEDMTGACLDGLQLIGCNLHQCDLAGVSLKGASITDTTFENVFADATTHLDGATLDALRFVGCHLDGMTAKAAQFRAIRFEFTSARGLDLTDASVSGLRHIRSDLAGLKAPMAYFSMVEGVETILAAAAMTENEKAAVRTLAVHGNRLAAQTYFDALQAQAVPA